MLSTLGRRTLMMTVRRFPVAALSTNLVAVEKSLENLFERMHWHDMTDEVKEIDHMLHEFKTNHAVAEPDAFFESQLTDKLQDITQLLKTEKPDHNAVNHNLLELKSFVKKQMYQE